VFFIALPPRQIFAVEQFLSGFTLRNFGDGRIEFVRHLSKNSSAAEKHGGKHNAKTKLNHFSPER